MTRTPSPPPPSTLTRTRHNGKQSADQRLKNLASYHPIDEANRPNRARKIRRSMGKYSQPREDQDSDTSTESDASSLSQNDESDSTTTMQASGRHRTGQVSIPRRRSASATKAARSTAPTMSSTMTKKSAKQSSKRKFASSAPERVNRRPMKKRKIRPTTTSVKPTPRKVIPSSETDDEDEDEIDNNPPCSRSIRRRASVSTSSARTRANEEYDENDVEGFDNSFNYEPHSRARATTTPSEVAPSASTAKMSRVELLLTSVVEQLIKVNENLEKLFCQNAATSEAGLNNGHMHRSDAVDDHEDTTLVEDEGQTISSAKPPDVDTSCRVTIAETQPQDMTEDEQHNEQQSSTASAREIASPPREPTQSSSQPQASQEIQTHREDSKGIEDSISTTRIDGHGDAQKGQTTTPRKSKRSGLAMSSTDTPPADKAISLFGPYVATDSSTARPLKKKQHKRNPEIEILEDNEVLQKAIAGSVFIAQSLISHEQADKENTQSQPESDDGLDDEPSQTTEEMRYRGFYLPHDAYQHIAPPGTVNPASLSRAGSVVENRDGAVTAAERWQTVRSRA